MASLPMSYSSSIMISVDHHGPAKRLTSPSFLSFETFPNVCGRFNPSKFVNKWGTPQLIIHGGKDYRLAETEGIGAFHALQQYV